METELWIGEDLSFIKAGRKAEIIVRVQGKLVDLVLGR